MKWNDAFKIAETYYHEHGNLLVPRGYSFDGFNLYNWISKQRYRYSMSSSYFSVSKKNQLEQTEQLAKAYSKSQTTQTVQKESPLTEDQIAALNSIGMIWNLDDYAWERAFAVAQKYYREHGNLLVPKHYEEDGVNLSHWIWTQRRIANGTNGVSSRKLTDEQIRRLESIGMEWAPKSKGFSYYYALAKRFYDAYGHTDFPKGDVTVDSEVFPESGESLAAWKREQEMGDFFEKNGSRAWERQRLLCEIGIDPAKKLTAWDKKYLAAERYYREHGDLLVPYSYITEGGITLGKWISSQRMKRRGTWGKPLTEEQICRLDAIGMSWDETENRGKRNKRG